MKITAKENLLEMILRSGNTVTSLAEKIGISRQSVNLIIRGKNGVNPINSKKILEVLDVGFDEVFEIKSKDGK